MQDRYAGDVGDFGKFALLHALMPGRKTGVGWYRTSGEREKTNDGRHVDYLQRPDPFRTLAPRAFDAMAAFVKKGERSVAALEACGVLPANVRYHSALTPRPGAARRAWFGGLLHAMKGRDLVMLDPDNGLEGVAASHKCVTLDELTQLRVRGRALVVYHHQTRRKGGAPAEFAHQAKRLQRVGFADVRAVRLRPYSSRFYFVLDGDAALHERLEAFTEAWGARAERFG